MKYSIIFAATAAASYDAYSHGYSEEAKVSSVAKPTSTPCSTAKPTGYTTVYPGYDKYPVTVTTQHQPYPTCVSAGYGGKTCDKWEEDMYVSTTIKDYDGHDKVITKTDEPVVVYHTKKTITHEATGKYGYPTSAAGYAKPTGAAYSKNGTEGCWYELYEKIEEVPYKQLGPHALPGYGGSNLYPEGKDKQPVKVKEYKGGKWTEYEHVYNYGKPKEEVKTYEKPGVYTIPSKDVYVDKPYTAPAVATKTAKAGETCTYGGAYAEATETGYMTAGYGAYETKYVNGKPVTETVVKYTTIYVTKTGTVEIAKPTTTVYDHDVEVVYPTAKPYEAGYYHQDAKTITVTKSGESYTCTYEKKDHPTPSSVNGYPVYPTKTPSYDNGYGYSKPSPSPYKPTEEEHKYPSYPVKGNGTYGQGYEAKTTPVAVYSKSYEHGYPAESSPIKATSTPCEESEYPAPTPSASKPVYPVYPAGSSSAPAYPEYPVKASSTPVYPVGASSTPVYPVKASSTPVYPVGASSTPCEEDQKPTPTPYKPNNEYGAYPPQKASSTPVYPEYPVKASSTPAYPEYPVKASSTPVYPEYPVKASSTPVYPVGASSTPVYPAYPVKATSTPVYPAAATSTPCEEDQKPSPTPYKPNNEYGAYPASPAKSTPAHEASYPAVTPAHEASYGTGYKRSRIARAL